MIRKLLPDMPTANPALGFGEAVLALVRLLSQTPLPPVIGVVGPPGSGRTTFLQAIETELDADHFVSVRLSASALRASSGQPAALLTPISHALHEEPSDERATTLAHEVELLIQGLYQRPNPTSPPGGSEHHLRATAAHRPRSRRQAHAQSGTALDNRPRLVVLIDDVEVGDEPLISLVHDLLAELGAVCIVACDDRPSAPQPRERLLQVTYRLPSVGLDQLAGLVDVTLAEADLPRHQAEELKGEIVPFLDHAVADQAVTPRALKRLVNAYIVAREIDHEHRLDPHALLAVLTIATRPSWRPAWSALLLYQDAFIDALNRITGGHAGAGRELDDLWLLPGSFLNFFEAHGPATALLTVDTVVPYLTQVPAALIPAPLPALRTLGAMRISLGVLGDADTFTDETKNVLTVCGSLSAAVVGLLPTCATAPALVEAARALHDRSVAHGIVDDEQLQAARQVAQACSEELLASIV